MDVSLIIPTRNNIHFTECCLRSLIRCWSRRPGGEEWEVILIDSGSEDGTELLPKHFRGAMPIRFLRYPGDHPTYSSVHNHVVPLARGDILVFVNNDIEIVSDDTVSSLIRLCRDQDVGVASNVHYFPDGSVNHFGIAFLEGIYPIHLLPHASRTPELSHPFEVPSVTFAFAAMRRELFLKIGGFDEAFRWSHEDVDLCLRVREAGYRCVVDPSTSIIHFGQSTPGRQDREEENLAYFRGKWTKPLPTPESVHRELGIRAGLCYEPAREVSPKPPRAAPDVDEKTIVFFTGAGFSALDHVLRRFQKHFRECEDLGRNWKVVEADIEEFSNYHFSDCVTVSFAHYWPRYFRRSRLRADRDFRFFAVNYARTGEEVRDLLTRHAVESRFQLLPISGFCEDYLLNAGVPSSRILPARLGFNPFCRPRPNATETRRKRFLVLTNSNDPYRYNAESVIEQWDRFAIGREVELVIKDYGCDPDYLPDLARRCETPVSIETRFLPDEEYAEFLASFDVLVAPFRGEGFGMKLLDAAASGLVIVCPRFGGPLEFLEPDNAVFVDGSMTPVGHCMDRDALGLDETYLDFEVDGEALLRALVAVYDSYDEWKKRALDRAEAIAEQFSWTAVGNELITSLREGIDSDSGTGTSFPTMAHQLRTVRRQQEQVDVSVLVNSYDRHDRLGELLHHLADLPDFETLSAEVIFVEDGTPSGAMIVDGLDPSRLPFDFTHAWYPENGGMCQSRNLLISLARGSVGIFLGDDIRPLPGALRRHWERHRGAESDRIAIVGHTDWGPSQRNHLLAEFATRYSPFQFDFEAVRNRERVDYRQVYTSNLSVSLSPIRDVPIPFEVGLDHILLYEDTAWGLDLESNGYSIFYDRKIQMLHQHDVDLEWLIRRSQIVGREAMRLYFVYPESAAFTNAETFLEQLEHARLTSREPEPDDSDIEEAFYQFLREYETWVEATDDCLSRESCKRQLHQLLGAVFRYNRLKGAASELDSRFDRVKLSPILLESPAVDPLFPGPSPYSETTEITETTETISAAAAQLHAKILIQYLLHRTLGVRRTADLVALIRKGIGCWKRFLSQSRSDSETR